MYIVYITVEPENLGGFSPQSTPSPLPSQCLHPWHILASFLEWKPLHHDLSSKLNSYVNFHAILGCWIPFKKLRDYMVCSIRKLKIIDHTAPLIKSHGGGKHPATQSPLSHLYNSLCDDLYPIQDKFTGCKLYRCLQVTLHQNLHNTSCSQ